MNCPKCGKLLDLSNHGEVVFDGQVWCSACHGYDWELVRLRNFHEMLDWCRRICTHFNHDPVALEGSPVSVFGMETKRLFGEADHQQRVINLSSSGYRLTTLCHELAHIFSGQGHTPEWARIFGQLVAWVRAELSSRGQ